MINPLQRTHNPDFNLVMPEIMISDDSFRRRLPPEQVSASEAPEYRLK
jgi:hypothetical protein